MDSYENFAPPLLQSEVWRYGGLRGGRKRKDGLIPGSPQAAEADRAKDAERKRRARAAARMARESITCQQTVCQPPVVSRLSNRPKNPIAGKIILIGVAAVGCLILWPSLAPLLGIGIVKANNKSL